MHKRASGKTFDPRASGHREARDGGIAFVAGDAILFQETMRAGVEAGLHQLA